ncbi:MAG: radical SAM protein, partial [archaeon]
RELYIIVTKDCIHDCIFCSIPKKEEYLELNEIKRRIKKKSKIDYNLVVFTGGEPTLHKDLNKAIKYSEELGMKTRIITNGVKFSDIRYANKLKKSGLKRIVVSIHHYNDQKLKEITKSDEIDLDKTLNGVKNALKLGIIVDINITVIKQNYKILPKLIQKLINISRNKINQVTFNYVGVEGNVLQKELNPKEIVPKYSESEKYLRHSFKLLKKNNISFRVERVPLCFTKGFIEYNSYANRMVGNEFYYTNELNENDSTSFYEKNFEKSENCKVCLLNNICPGVEKRYSRVYGNNELKPVYENPNKIELKIKRESNYKEEIILSKYESNNKKSNEISLLIEHFGGINSLIKKDSKNLIINGDNNYFKEKIFRNFKEILKKVGYNENNFNNFSKNGATKKLNMINPKIKSSLKVPSQIIDCDFIINFSYYGSQNNTIFHFLQNILKSNYKIEKLNEIQKNQLISELYSTIKSKIKINIGLFNYEKQVVGISRDFNTLEKVNEIIFNKDKSIFSKIIEKKNLGPKRDEIEIKQIN